MAAALTSSYKVHQLIVQVRGEKQVVTGYHDRICLMAVVSDCISFG